jgi:hypothetical protein
MLLKYARKQRASIYHPATIEDLPFEVLREALLYLKPRDLVAPSRVNRYWRPAAQDVQRAQLRIIEGGNEILDASLMSGIQLSRIVFGSDAFSIKHLVIDLRLVDQDNIPILARLVSHTLRNLELNFDEGEESESHYATLDQFFSQCHGIRNLKLRFFDFADNPSNISQTIKDGFYRLSQLSLRGCGGDLRMFVVSVPILNLHSFSNLLFGEIGGEDIVSIIATNYPTIKRLRLSDSYNSSTTLLKFVEFCRYIEEISFSESSGRYFWKLERSDIEAIASLPRLKSLSWPGRDIWKLKKSDIEAIASLPHLKSLNIDCWIENDDALSALSRCKGLKHLTLVDGVFDLSHILPVIGKNLVSLDYTSSTAFLETVDAVVEHCPNLQILDLGDEELDAVDLLKGGLKKLVKLNFNGDSVRLGTDWEGYR